MYAVETDASNRFVIRNTKTDELVKNKAGRIETHNTRGMAELIARKLK